RKCTSRHSDAVSLSLRARVSTSPQNLEHLLAGMPVLLQPDLRLESLDRLPRHLADLAVDLAIVIAKRKQALLQFLRFAETQPFERPVPVPREATIARDLVGEKADGQRIFVGVVVALQYEEVLRHQESGSFAPVGHLQLGIVRRTRKRL